MDTVLTLSKVSKSFPGVKALQNVDWSLERGEIHALLGENGAGKSTLMKILSGIYRPDEGTITVDGKVQRFETYNDAIAAGIAIIFQEFSLIPDLNAVENIFLGRELKKAGGLLDKGAMKAKAQKVFEDLGVPIPLNVPVRALSVAQQQFIEIGKALSLDARILILDEPTATLTPNEAEHLFHIMRALKAKGVAMAFISHHMEEILEICDRVTVLRDGTYVGTAPVKGVDVDGLVEMMVGRRLDQTFPAKHQGGPGKMLIEVRELQESPGGPNNPFHLRAGEILGFAGLVGSGRSEAAMALIGAVPVHKKDVLFEGQPAKLKDPADALARGIGILPESRKTQGLILDASVRKNISINNLRLWRRLGWLIDRKAEKAQTAAISAKVRVKTPSVETAVGTLSGGNQQKVVIARWLTRQCRVLIFDEPTRGIDVGAKAEIYALMRDLTRKGYAIVMISSELPEVIGMCDRVAVFRQGAIVATLEGDAINSNEVMRHATGF